MSRIVLSEFISLDGVIEAPENWHFPYISEDMAADIETQINAGDGALMGRMTYETFASYWPTQTNNEFGIADKLNNQRKYVVSTTLKKADWNNTTVISKNVVEAITQLKQQPGGDIGITGSATLAQTLMQANLIDIYRLYVHPIVVGGGLRLFQDGIQLTLKQVETKEFQSGVKVLVYEPDRK